MLSLAGLPRRTSVTHRHGNPVQLPVDRLSPRRLFRIWVNVPLAIMLLAALLGTSLSSARPAAAASSSRGATVASIAMRYVGSRYVHAGASPRGFDCSGLVMYVYGRVGVRLPHKASMQFSSRYGTIIRSRSALRAGDVVFFANTAGPGITHAAIYVGNGRMVSANNPRQGVRLENINTRYWVSHFAGAMRPY
jgi:cell wall-associated NlpC family hydrolase